MKKNLSKYEKFIFALLMSFSTAFIVSFAMTIIHRVQSVYFIKVWVTSLLLAWPFVFISILFVAPIIQKLTRKIIESFL